MLLLCSVQNNVVSRYDAVVLRSFVSYSSITVVVFDVSRLHVGMGKDAHGLRTFCDNEGIRTFAYGAVGEPGPNIELLSDPVVTQIAEQRRKSPEQVAVRWVLQSGAAVSVRPTLDFGLGVGACRQDDNSCERGLASRASSFHWSLSTREMQVLSAMTSPDDNPTLFSSAGCPGAFVMPK